MNRMKSLGTLAAFGLLFGMVGCDLDVTNPNQPNRERALATPDDVEALITGSYATWFGSAQYWNSFGVAVEVASDHGSASWGNFGMQDASEEPRKALDNNPSYGYSYIIEEPWSDFYGAISAASDGIRAIEGGLDIGPNGERNARAIAFAKFMQGLGHCYLALLYDKAFVIDENTDFEGELSTVPYTEMMQVGLQKLSEARQEAGAMGMATQASWMGGNAFSPAEFQSLISSYTARCKAGVARDPQERAAANWAGIRADVQAGIQGDFEVTGAQAGADPWWSGIKTLGGADAGWVRSDYHWIGQADQSGGYQNWLNTPVASRQPFNVITPDQRLPQNPGVNGDQGLMFTWHSSIPHPPERGTYHLSHYTNDVWADYLNSCAFCYFGTFAEMTATEMRLLEAEALLRGGDAAGAANLVNVTRVGNGGLTPVTGAGTVPNEPGGGCVPRPRFDTTGSCGDLMDALQYEHYMEIFQVSAGLTYFFTRGHGELVPGTFIHMPIPGSELEVLQMDIYTFGGPAGGAAPNLTPSPDELMSGDLEVLRERAAFSLDALQRRQEQEQRQVLELIPTIR